MAELTIPSHGARMNGLIYLAAGTGSHPVVIFLHGFPGNERNLDLAQAVRRAGYHSLYTDFRGMWGSAGEFSFSHGLEDVTEILAWVRAPGTAATYHIDTTRIAIVGHSYGGWLALMSAGAQPPSVCVAAMAAWNIGWDAEQFAAQPALRSDSFESLRGATEGEGAPVAADADTLLMEMSAHADEWNYLSQSSGLAKRALLLAAVTRDSPDEDVKMHQRLAKAVRAAGGQHVQLITYDDDHPFSSHRIALADALTHWLRGDCARTQPPVAQRQP